ncbi:hypothetical protein KKC17_04115 [Patescibacteria group bacterium]|nr:hypothetical protein [Patescibacteria group bacterium]
MYLQTSADILNIAIAISVVGVSFLLGWLLIYALVIIRRLVKITALIEQGALKLENLINLVKEKLESSASYLSILAVGLKDLVGYILEKKLTQKTSSTKKK